MKMDIKPRIGYTLLLLVNTQFKMQTSNVLPKNAQIVVLKSSDNNI